MLWGDARLPSARRLLVVPADREQHDGDGVGGGVHSGRQPVEALAVDDTGFVKDGTASPCVARQYSGTLGEPATARSG